MDRSRICILLRLQAPWVDPDVFPRPFRTLSWIHLDHRSGEVHAAHRESRFWPLDLSSVSVQIGFTPRAAFAPKSDPESATSTHSTGTTARPVCSAGPVREQALPGVIPHIAAQSPDGINPIQPPRQFRRADTPLSQTRAGKEPGERVARWTRAASAPT